MPVGDESIRSSVAPNGNFGSVSIREFRQLNESAHVQSAIITPKIDEMQPHVPGRHGTFFLRDGVISFVALLLVFAAFETT